jgi:methyltransferase (TIGR00027 family)
VRACSDIGIERLHFVAADLSGAALDREALIRSSFDPTQRTFWIAEGLLMYLTGETVSLLMRTLASLSAPGSQFAFTFMEKQADRRIRFDSQTKLVDWWLSKRGEPFVWGSTRDELVDLVRPWQIVRFFDHDDLRKEFALADELIAKGEVICLAEI